jgi:hypothetical protein
VSGSVAVIVVQRATQSIPPPEGAAACCKAWVGCNQPVSESLVVPFPMVMSQKLMHGFPQRALAEQDQTLYAGLLDGADKAFCVGIPVR